MPDVAERAHYYAVRVAPRTEIEVERRLAKRGNATILPIEFKWVRVSGRGRWREKRPYPMLPRYVFAGFEGWDDWYRLLRELAGQGLDGQVQGIVAFGGRRDPLPEREVRFLASLPSLPPEGLPATNIHKALRSGGMAEIVDGPFAGQTVRVDSVARRRAKVLLKVLNGMHLVEVPLTALEPV
jgi:transcription antitermination factor NusG